MKTRVSLRYFVSYCSETSKMELSAKIVDCIQPLAIFAKHFILGVSQGYKYASHKAKQNPGVLSLVLQKN